MARLYYETPKRKDNLQVTQKNDASQYLEKVSRLIPGEIIAMYLTLVGLSKSVTLFDTQIMLWSVFGLGLILTPIYLNYQANKDKEKENVKGPKAIHLIVSTVAFVVWAYQCTGEKLVPAGYDAAFASMVLIVFSVVSGFIPMRIKSENE